MMTAMLMLAVVRRFVCAQSCKGPCASAMQRKQVSHQSVAQCYIAHTAKPQSRGPALHITSTVPSHQTKGRKESSAEAMTIC
jgi:hypothetical protein